MKFDKRIDLIKLSSSKNDIGDSIPVETKTSVYADKLKVTQSEAYQAMAQGIKPIQRFKIRSNVYNGHEYFEYKSKKYKIIRVYDDDGDFIELTGESTVNNNAIT